MAIGNEDAYEFSLNSGPDANKPTDPQAGDIYISTDTKQMFICYAAGVWQISSPLSVDSDGILKFNNKTVWSSTDVVQIAAADFSQSSNTLTPSADWTHISVTAYCNGYILILTTSPTAAGINDSNILTAGGRYPTNAPLTEIIKLSDNVLIPSGKPLYMFQLSKAISSYETLLTEAKNAVPFATTAAQRFAIKKAQPVKVPSWVI